MSESAGPPVTASVSTQVNLAPKASQTFLVSITVLAGVCIVCGAGLLSTEKEAGWGFVALASVLMGVAVRAWLSSQSDTDLHASTPTTITLPHGRAITTDSRNLRSKTAVDGLIQLCEAYHRTPLPQADGIIENGVIVPDSAAEAQARVLLINAEGEAQAAAVDELVNGPADGPVVSERTPAIDA